MLDLLLLQTLCLLCILNFGDSGVSLDGLFLLFTQLHVSQLQFSLLLLLLSLEVVFELLVLLVSYAHMHYLCRLLLRLFNFFPGLFMKSDTIRSDH